LLQAANKVAELSIIVPTFNERDNVDQLARRLHSVLKNTDWELVIIDDDSPDGTANRVRELARGDARIRCLQRIGRRGLSSACIEGMLAISSPYIAIMDGDLQHDEKLLPEMLRHLKNGELDIVIGSRYVAGGSAAALGPDRTALSLLAARISRRLIPDDLMDPMSGFFMLRREVVDETVRRLSGFGFKILLDIFASSPRSLKFVELPYEFRERQTGASKLDNRALWDYVMLLADKLLGRIVPVRFLSFIFVGGMGVFVHMALLALMIEGVGLTFVWSQIIATLFAMTSNFALNNLITYRDLQLRGFDWVRGWFSFSLACSIGAVANIGVADFLFTMNAGWPISGLAGILIGAVWNYVITRVYTWKIGVPARR
jgi:dolichol-phosphate mannosyltransferase